ncbi:3-phenylpropionate/cinnamic acid dioxygenase subunit alpha [Variovorax sp. SRS16]|uniref:aromatic ring-hydroxylating dioxygenase subunit alpha n=1 Tax=Variovorax sp. SRS16 TaxID=282217 RepID=UPI001317868B|nr:aromatic ring-hydroxylating dioxygenase subunit alpha [Variovorax sp. SRS16]VTU21038.1 3-phenylpropionate/cinnamic acid dioxygenase subunit alpha [Variovorax sp. SRS16]
MDIDPSRLVQPDRVHKRVYTDPAIYELEMDRLFGRAWLYVGHESQVPKPGDYFTTRLGREPMVMLRHTDGSVQVLYNRCAHKGARIVPEGSGSVGKFMRCLYHGWAYHCDGTLLSVPLRSGYEDTALDLQAPQFSVRKAARVASYRGFVFASLAADGPDLETFLGGVATSLDNFCDRAPDGEVEVAGGVQRVIQRNNWKIFFENLHDTLHAVATHESSWRAAKEEYESMPPGTPKPFEIVIVDGNGEPLEFWEKLELKGYDRGHGYMEGIFTPPTDPVSLAYVAALKDKQGEARADQILRVNRHNTIVYPSCSPHTSFQQIRVIRPLAVDRTLVEIFTFRLKGAPDATFQRALKYTNVVNSPSSNVMPDDLEAYNRVQEGLGSDGGDWVSLHRAAGREQPIEGGRASNGNSEMPMRNMFQAWAGYMRDAGEAS